ncbi:hypothetical protein A6D6_00130 [Alcanivorax xiamenensis]|uniref:Tetratricopeptide repeat-containing protein n=2 Tax=Alcanivoracaceae TaxID=224372 RepID=A0ABQ6YDM0_9GAMM|nr:hypothetical protein A6D6_00130 [Alcanivorax xiamenensis]
MLVMPLWLTGCAVGSLFQPYPSQAQSWVHPAPGRDAAIVQHLERAGKGRDGVLYLQELGLLQQRLGNDAASRTVFADVINHYEHTDAQALIRVTGLASQTGALLINDNALPYRAPDYERIFTHSYQALNYWAAGDVTGTAVELRRAAQAQRLAEQRREGELAEVDEDAASLDLSQYQGYFEGLDAAAGAVKSSFQNAWTFYLSALFWEAHGEYNDALVDYKKALELHPRADWLKADVQRVSRALDGHREQGTGTVAVLYEQGEVPARQEVSLPIPTPHGLFLVAFPSYSVMSRSAPRPLTFEIGGQTAQTRVLADVGALAARNLREQAPAMLIRQVLRATGKYNLQKKANDDFGSAGAFLTQLFNLISEQADRRSWLGLPAYAQAGRVTVPVGEQQVLLSGPGGDASVTVPVAERGLTLIHVTERAGRLVARVLPVQEGPL